VANPGTRGAVVPESLGLLGLARRAGAVRTGVGAARTGIRDGEVGLLILASDGADGQLNKALRLAMHRAVPVRWVASREGLGMALGEGPLTAVAVDGGTFAETLAARLPDRREDPGRRREESGIDAGR
jgi:ribosomal protein L7Ae-like RNA K-turn-binding protein